MFAPLELIQTEVFTEVPQALRKTSTNAERIAAGRGMPKAGCFLEGPSFDRAGNLYFIDQGQTDLNCPTGRVYCLTAAGRLRCVADNVPSPNGLVSTLRRTCCISRSRAPMQYGGCRSRRPEKCPAWVYSCSSRAGAAPTASRSTRQAGLRSRIRKWAQSGFSVRAASRSIAYSRAAAR